MDSSSEESRDTLVSGDLSPLSHRLEETHIVVSDFHMSAGPDEQWWARQRWPWRLAERFKSDVMGTEVHDGQHPTNPLEDFPDDEVFVRFLDRVWEKYGSAPRLVLRLLGDTFDSLAVSWFGGYQEPPYEAAAVHKFKKIIAGHPRFFDALNDFLQHDNCQLVFFVGNHDLFLVWPAVQRRLVRRISDGNTVLAARIRFVDQRQNFEETHRDVLYIHGMAAEVQNSVPPDQIIVRECRGRPLSRPALNMPHGSFVYGEVVNRIKRHNPLVGRLVNYQDLIANATVRRWGWVLYTLVVLVLFSWWHLWLAWWKWRRRTTVSRGWQTIKQAVVGDTVDRYALRLLQERSETRVLIMGHSHEWRCVSSQQGTYLNVGTWSLMYDLAYPQADGQLAVVSKSGVSGLRPAVKLSLLLLFVTLVGSGVILATGLSNWWILPVVGVYLALSLLIRFLSVKPRIVSRRRFTFAVVRHYTDGGLRAGLREYLPDTDELRDCV